MSKPIVWTHGLNSHRQQIVIALHGSKNIVELVNLVIPVVKPQNHQFLMAHFSNSVHFHSSACGVERDKSLWKKSRWGFFQAAPFFHCMGSLFYLKPPHKPSALWWKKPKNYPTISVQICCLSNYLEKSDINPFLNVWRGGTFTTRCSLGFF